MTDNHLDSAKIFALCLLLGAAVLLLVISTGCTGFPLPPDFPFPPPAPGECFDCEAAEARFESLSDFDKVLRAEDPVPGCYKVKLLPGGAPQALSLVAAAQSIAGAYGITVDYTFEGLAVFTVEDVPKSVARQIASVAGRLVAECERVEAIEVREVFSWGQEAVFENPRVRDGRFEQGGWDGTGVHVMVNDTGRPSNTSGFRNVGQSWSAVGDSGLDDHDHGSHVGGTIAHRDFGIAPGATIHWCKSLIRGSGSDADVMECRDLFLEACQSNGWRCVINESLGGSPDDIFDRHGCTVAERGALLVVAAGNDSRDACMSSPARIVQAATMGATNEQDCRASFSNLGPGVDIFAPGDRIRSCNKACQAREMSGTSMASPHGAGAAALVWQRLGDAKPAEVLASMVDRSVTGVCDRGEGSPNLRLYVGE